MHTTSPARASELLEISALRVALNVRAASFFRAISASAGRRPGGIVYGRAFRASLRASAPVALPVRCTCSARSGGLYWQLCAMRITVADRWPFFFFQSNRRHLPRVHCMACEGEGEKARDMFEDWLCGWLRDGR